LSSANLSNLRKDL